VTTVRSQQKADKIKEAYPNTPVSELDFRIVEDIAQEGAFDEAVKIDGLEAVIHTASPVGFDFYSFCRVVYLFTFIHFAIVLWQVKSIIELFTNVMAFIFVVPLQRHRR
jgi:hypothetical protein